MYTPVIASLGSMTDLLTQIVIQAVPSTEARLFYYSSDHLGTTQIITDESAQVVWQGDYSPFGTVDVIVNNLEKQ